jgi:hypothetical protein
MQGNIYLVLCSTSKDDGKKFFSIDTFNVTKLFLYVTDADANKLDCLTLASIFEAFVVCDKPFIPA